VTGVAGTVVVDVVVVDVVDVAGLVFAFGFFGPTRTIFGSAR
jgi:hypothetical protein